MSKAPSNARSAAVPTAESAPTRASVETGAPETTWWDAFCDLWIPPEEVDFASLDYGYGARMRDAMRIRGDFDNAIAGLGLRQEERQQQPTAVTTPHTQVFSGPLPTPEALAKYDEVLPGAADRILRMVEKEARDKK